MTPDDTIVAPTPLARYLTCRYMARGYARRLRLESDDVHQKAAVLVIRNAHQASPDNRQRASRLTNLLVRSAAVGLAR